MKFSIIIPIHNGANYIVRCLSSIAKQTMTDDNYEVIVVNDMSTDNSGFIAERFGEDFKNFKLLNTTYNAGPGGARNLGVKNAVGDYIVFIDCDDYIAETMLNELDEAATKSANPDILFIQYTTLRANSKNVDVSPSFPDISKIAFSAVGPWTAVYKREKYVNMPECTLSEDTAWHFEQYDKFDTFAVTDSKKPLYFYDRTNATAITDTVEWCGKNSNTVERLAFENLAVNAGKNDRWISDVIRNFANMYDVRHKLTKPGVRQAWVQRFKTEYQNIMTGHFCH